MSVKSLMNSDDVVYVGTMLLCLAAARLHRQSGSCVVARQTLGSALGLLVVCLVCGAHSKYAFVLIACNLAIMNVCNRLYIHDASLAFSWLYLVFLFYRVPMSAYALALNQVLALRLVGLASDLNTSDNIKAETVDGLLTCGSKFNIEADVMPRDPDIMEMVHYSVSFIGIHKGPYYRWKTFSDHFTQPLASLEDCHAVAVKKLKKAALFAVIYLWLSFNYPVEEYNSSEFYKGWAVHRFMYNVPQLIRFLLASQIVALLSAAVCSEAGFVLNPTTPQPPANVPATDLRELNQASSSFRPSPSHQELNLNTIKGYDNKAILLGPTMRQTLRGWDMSVQYWFWVHVYRKIHHHSRFVKSTISFIVWSVWCGLTKNQLILAPTLWLYINLEDEYGDLCSKPMMETDTTQNIWNVSISLMRLLCLVYITPCLILKRRLIHYYNSVFWLFHLMLVTLGAGAVAAGRPVLRRGEPSRVDLARTISNIAQ